MHVAPICQEFSFSDPLSIFSLFARQDGAIFLDSAELRQHCGQYSFIAIDPFKVIKDCSFETLMEILNEYPLATIPNAPPFQGGAAGFLSYELGHHLEKIKTAKINDMQFPEIMLGLYDLVLAFDYIEKRAWVFSSGYPEKEKGKREFRAKQRLNSILSELKKAVVIHEMPAIKLKNSLVCNFTRQEYVSAVQKTVEYILEGDIFEANLSQRFTAQLSDRNNAFELYCRLRQINPAPFSAYVNFGETILASSSPERFLKCTQGCVETRPIKGTSKRGTDLAMDEVLAQELVASAKNRAENIMIVDLMRNDLSRVCQDHSVQVSQLCGLESYASVHHLVSVVTGKLKTNLNVIDLLRATFPGGSITGAPKIRAMEIIAELEPTLRGPYCGSIGYVGFNGDMDLSITIRTYCIKNNIVSFQVGGAITADSDPELEYEETLIKANKLLLALGE